MIAPWIICLLNNVKMSHGIVTEAVALCLWYNQHKRAYPVRGYALFGGYIKSVVRISRPPVALQEG